MNEIKRLQQLAGITEIKVNNPILQKVKKLFVEIYEAPEYGYDGNLSEEVEEQFITPNNIDWGDDEFLIDLFDRLPSNELNRLYEFLLKYESPKSNDDKDEDWIYDLDEIKVNRPKRIWDLTKYNPTFTGKDIQIGDEIKLLKLIVIDSIEDDIQDEKEYYAAGIGYYTSDWLRDINNRNKNK